MSETTLKEKTVKGLFWGGLSSGIQQILQFVFGIMMLRLLTPDDYGIVGLLAIFQAIAWLLMDCGFGTAVINKKDANKEDYNTLFGFSMLVCTICYIVLFIAAPYIAKFYREPALVSLSRIYFLPIVFAGSAVAQSTYLFKELKSKERAIIDFSALSVSGIAGIIMAFNGYSYWALAVQHVLSQNVH